MQVGNWRTQRKSVKATRNQWHCESNLMSLVYSIGKRTAKLLAWNCSNRVKSCYKIEFLLLKSICLSQEREASTHSHLYYASSLLLLSLINTYNNDQIMQYKQKKVGISLAGTISYAWRLYHLKLRIWTTWTWL